MPRHHLFTRKCLAGSTSSCSTWTPLASREYNGHTFKCPVPSDEPSFVRARNGISSRGADFHRVPMLGRYLSSLPSGIQRSPPYLCSPSPEKSPCGKCTNKVQSRLRYVLGAVADVAKLQYIAHESATFGISRRCGLCSHHYDSSHSRTPLLEDSRYCFQLSDTALDGASFSECVHQNSYAYNQLLSQL